LTDEGQRSGSGGLRKYQSIEENDEKKGDAVR
jgi:hypothetical protein